MIIAVISLGGLGFIAGLGLALASKKLAVEVDPRIEEIEDLLAGANCGACGYPGCSAFARAILAKEAEVNQCTSLDNEGIAKIAKIAGVEAKAASNLVAMVYCKGGKREVTSRFDYQGIESCKAAALIAGGNKSCEYGCLGFGSCEKACSFDAITMDDNRLPIIDRERCVGCGKCVEACPKNLISLVPETQYIHIQCHSNAQGSLVKKVCPLGCIGCGLCEKFCPFDAITVENNLAKIDYEKCRNCGICILKCPTGIISDLLDIRPSAKIRQEECTGCGLCARVCPIEAITGKPKKPYRIDPEKCIGCGLCREKCKKEAIEINRELYIAEA
jgi:electron transport complex protein RnfB